MTKKSLDSPDTVIVSNCTGFSCGFKTWGWRGLSHVVIKHGSNSTCRTGSTEHTPHSGSSWPPACGGELLDGAPQNWGADGVNEPPQWQKKARCGGRDEGCGQRGDVQDAERSLPGMEMDFRMWMVTGSDPTRGRSGRRTRGVQSPAPCAA